MGEKSSTDLVLLRCGIALQYDARSCLLRLDGAPVCRAYRADGRLQLEFLDRDRRRTHARGSEQVRVDADDFLEALELVAHERRGG